MAVIGDAVYDEGLDRIADHSGAARLVLHICSGATLPETYAEVTAATLGNKTEITVTGPQAGDPDGREVVMDAIGGGDPGDVTDTDEATCFALVDSDGSGTFLVSQDLAASQQVTDGNDFTLTSWVLRIPAPVI